MKKHFHTVLFQWIKSTSYICIIIIYHEKNLHSINVGPYFG